MHASTIINACAVRVMVLALCVYMYIRVCLSVCLFVCVCLSVTTLAESAGMWYIVIVLPVFQWAHHMHASILIGVHGEQCRHA